MKDQREIDVEQSLRQIAQWADRQDHAKHKSNILRSAARIGGSLLYFLIASLVLLALLGVVRQVP